MIINFPFWCDEKLKNQLLRQAVTEVNLPREVMLQSYTKQLLYQTPYHNVLYPLDNSLWMGCSTKTPGYWAILFCTLHQMYRVHKFY